MRKLITHKELDQRLELAAKDPEGFEALADAVIAELDAADADLEISDPRSWRRHHEAPPRTTFLRQFRADVDSIIPLEREEEAALARRIELARVRLERARQEAGLDDGEAEG